MSSGKIPWPPDWLKKAQETEQARRSTDEWRVVYVKSNPPQFHLYTPYYKGALILSREQLLQWDAIRAEAVAQKLVWLPNSLRKRWEGECQQRTVDKTPKSDWFTHELQRLHAAPPVASGPAKKTEAPPQPRVSDPQSLLAKSKRRLKPIETQYKGYRFRSRLEARWAVFFDALGVAWEYEPEGYTLPSGTRYLPDFWLPREATWVEIKPEGQMPDRKFLEFAGEVKHTIEYEEVWRFSKLAAESCLFVSGNPGWSEYRIHHTGIGYDSFSFCPLCKRIVAYNQGHATIGLDGTTGIYCDWCDMFERRPDDNAEGYFHKGDTMERIPGWIRGKLNHAYNAARSARFEFGEHGR